MKYYIIKIKESNAYVSAVTFGGDPFLQIIATFDEENAAVYEEDKAKKYVEELNKQQGEEGEEGKEGKEVFELIEVEPKTVFKRKV